MGSRQPFKWTEATDRNFKLLKKKITKKPIIALQSFDKVFQVERDAPGIRIGVVLIQEQRPMEYFSKNLNEENTSIPHMTRIYMLLYKISRNGDIT